jgi:hypothetical protein
MMKLTIVVALVTTGLVESLKLSLDLINLTLLFTSTHRLVFLRPRGCVLPYRLGFVVIVVIRNISAVGATVILDKLVESL